MLSDNDFSIYCDRIGLSVEARAVIKNIRLSSPFQRNQSGANRVAPVYPSRKMGFAIQAANQSLQYAAVYRYEHNDDVLEYWDEPGPIKVNTPTRPDGKRGAYMAKPPFFVMHQNSAGWEEWKSERWLERQAGDQPHLYQLDDQGTWHYIPGEEYAANLGLTYLIRSDAELDNYLVRNLHFLGDYLGNTYTNVPDSVHSRFLSLVHNTPGITLEEILAPETLSSIDGATSDDLYVLIARDEIFVDLEGEPLAEPDLVHLYADPETAETYHIVRESEKLLDHPQIVKVDVGITVNWDGQIWEIANVGMTEISLQSKQSNRIIMLSHEHFRVLVADGKISSITSAETDESASKVQDILRRASPEAQKKALEAYKKIKPYLDKDPPSNDTTPARTRRNWIKKYRDAERMYGNGFIGLLPRTNESGNFGSKLSETTRLLMQEFIQQSYQTPTRKTKKMVYGELLLACERTGVNPPSYRTFTKAVDMQDTYEQTVAREGTRAAYNHKPKFRYARRHTPVHGDRPMEVAHLDHTQLNIELRDSITGRNLGRPWITNLVDAKTRRDLALYATFNPPSTISAMMTLRECVRRFGRLPEAIVVDNGKEFSSSEFESLLAWYRVTKLSRPPAEPHFGSPGERHFGTIQSEFIHNLQGNTQNTKNPRQLTDGVDPKRHAVWTLAKLYVRLREFAYEIYDTTDHPALGQTPREAFEQGLYRTGDRPYRLISYDETFIMLTTPTTDKGVAKVQPNNGIKIFGRYYWADIMKSPDVENTNVPVRYDPDDSGIAYAYIKGQWVRCISDHYSLFQGRSPRQIKLATEEYRKRVHLHNKNSNVSAAKIAAWLETVKNEESFLLNQLRDAENRGVNALINLPMLPDLAVADRGLLKRTTEILKGDNTIATDPTDMSRSNLNVDDDDEYFNDIIYGTYEAEDQ